MLLFFQGLKQMEKRAFQIWSHQSGPVGFSFKPTTKSTPEENSHDQNPENTEWVAKEGNLFPLLFAKKTFNNLPPRPDRQTKPVKASSTCCFPGAHHTPKAGNPQKQTRPPPKNGQVCHAYTWRRRRLSMLQAAQAAGGWRDGSTILSSVAQWCPWYKLTDLF